MLRGVLLPSLILIISVNVSASFLVSNPTELVLNQGLDVNFRRADFALFSASSASKDSVQEKQEYIKEGNVLILDHLNINHEKGCHDLVKAFYFDFLKCAVDPRKAENLELGKKTLWANIGSNQFHLPEGKPEAQVFQGVVTLAYPKSFIQKLLEQVDSFYDSCLGSSKFKVKEVSSNELSVLDPWGTQFRLLGILNEDEVRDERGKQPGAESEGIAMTDLTVYVNDKLNFAGIARFYEQVLGAPSHFNENDPYRVVIDVGPKQTLTFVGKADDINHAELVKTDNGIENFGAHISMYIADLQGAYIKANEFGVTYVNTRFKRRAFNLDEAIDQCMFRIIDIVDPENLSDGPILKLEHEIRSVTKRDGRKYKSCPFNDIPDICLKKNF